MDDSRAPRLTTALLAGLLASGCAEPLQAPTCLTVGFVAEIAVTNIDKVDLLFVVDDSQSMHDEQATLARELPRLVEMLLTGERPGKPAFPSVSDLHVGVVSADLGAPPGFDGCDARGRDALLQLGSGTGTCGSMDDPFLTSAGIGASDHPLLQSLALDATEELVGDFACRIAFGAEGCGVSQPLEAALKALWPSVDRDRATGEVIDPNRLQFLDGSGHGDREHAGFLRNDPVEGISLVAVIVVTDADDCSIADADVFASGEGATATAHCVQSDSLFRIERYVNGLRALREGQENLVLFGAIAGFPVDRVNDEARASVDFSVPASRDEFYGDLLADPRMQNDVGADGALAFACESAAGSATPARRIAAVAQQFGEQGLVHSICDDDWSGAIDGIVEVVAKRLASFLPPLRLDRAQDGRTACDVTWELPAADEAPPGTPTRCDEADFLSADLQRPMSKRGGERCIVRELAVRGLPDRPVVEEGDGWFYDDFTTGPHCWNWPDRGCDQVFFSPVAHPPTGVTVTIECLEQTYSLPARDDLDPSAAQPEVFDECDPAVADACHRILADPAGGADHDGIDRALFCHPERAACVLGCADASCPTGWSCNDEDLPWCEPRECRVPG